MSRLKQSAKVGAVCCALIGGAEGLRQNAYPDPATRGAPWTICYGETEGVKPGDHRTLAECKAGLLKEADVKASEMEACIHRPMSDGVYIAFTSLAYNIGSRNFCRSSVARLYNAGEPIKACDAMLRFNRAAGITFPGLTERRHKERAMCLQGSI